jgi:tRNA threonylcarbamoyladenosine biosynthesis protein TsaB
MASKLPSGRNSTYHVLHHESPTHYFPYTGPMLFIVVDTADARGSVALCRDAQILCVEVHSTDEDYSSWLLPAVRRVLAGSSLRLAELDGYAVCAGPGSFTGLRVGLTTVKAWAEIYGRPIAAVSRLEALTLSAPPMEQDFVAAYIDARRAQVFAALHKRRENGFQLLGEESVIALDQFFERVAGESVGQTVCWISPDTQLIESLPQWRSLPGSRHRLQHVAPPFAALLGRLASQKFLQGNTTDAVSLDANYVRRSDAEIFWKATSSAAAKP